MSARSRSSALSPRVISDPQVVRPLSIRLLDVSVVAVAVLLALLPLLPVFGIAAALPAVLGGVFLGAGVAALAVWRGWPVVVTMAVAIISFVILGGAAAAPRTTVAGFVPTVDTLVTLAQGVVTSWKQILTLEPPIGRTGTGLVAPYVLGLVAVLCGGLVAAGRSTGVRLVSTGAIPVAVLVLSILLGTVEKMLAVVIGVSITVLLVVWTAWRRGRWRPRRVFSLALLATVAIGGGVVTAPLVASDTPRFVLRSTIVPPFDPRQYASPLAGYRTFVREQADAPLISVTDLPEDGEVRLATMDYFDGVLWNVMGEDDGYASGAFRRIGDVIPTSVQGAKVEVDITILGLTGPWVPTVGETTGISFDGLNADAATNAFRFNDVTGTGALDLELTEGQRYTLQAVVPPVRTDEEIGAAKPGNVTMREPSSVPEIVRSRASEVTTQDLNPAQQARSIEQHLVTSGFFSHGIEANGDYPSLSGHSAYRVNRLLGERPMVGDAEQYASAMALMASEQGLPARVVLGFIPDEDQRGEKTIVFTGKQVQAWVEINYAGIGWVSYFPTPPSTQTPTEIDTVITTPPEPEVRQPPPLPAEPVVPPKEKVEDPVVESKDDPAPEVGSIRQLVIVTTAVAVPVLLLAIPVLVIVGLKARRRRKRRKAPQLAARISGGWTEMLDTARDFGTVAQPEATRREAARLLSTVYPQIPALVLAGQADAATFSAATPDESTVARFWTIVDEARGVIRGQGSMWVRVRGRLSLASLRTSRTTEKTGLLARLLRWRWSRSQE